MTKGFKDASNTKATISTGNFSNIFKTHLYHKKSIKKDTDLRDKDTRQGLDSFIYSNQTPPKSAGISLIDNSHASKSKSRDSQGGSNSSENIGPQLASNSTHAAIPTHSSIVPARPKFYRNGESSLIKRGKFKGIHDNRHVRCLFYENKPTIDSYDNYWGCQNHHTNRCYCCHISIVSSPLRKVVNLSDIDKMTNTKDYYGTSHRSILEFFPPDNKSREFQGHIITRVKQRFNGDYDSKVRDKTSQKVKRVHSLNNIRRFGYHARVPEESQELIVKPSITNSVSTA